MMLQFKPTVKDSEKVKTNDYLGNLNSGHSQVIWRRHLNIKGCRKLLVLLAIVHETTYGDFVASLSINTASKRDSLYNGFGDYLYQGSFSVKDEAIMKLHELKNEFETAGWYAEYVKMTQRK